MTPEQKERKRLYDQAYRAEIKACPAASAHRREQDRLAQRRWAAENPEKKRRLNAAWAAANKEKIAEKGRRWRQENRERYNEVQRKWRQANPEKAKATAARHRAKRRAA